MYRWAPGKRTRVQSEPAPSDCVWPLEFDRFREGQNPPLLEIGFCTGLCKGSLDNRCTTGLGEFGDHPFHAAHPLLRARRGGGADGGAVKSCNIACHFAVARASAVNAPFFCQVPKFVRSAFTGSKKAVL